MATPERTGCTLLMTMQKANMGVSSTTSSCTCESFENKEGYCSRKMIRTSDIKRPIRNEVITATTSENFAALGWHAPSSFDTLTLHSFRTHIKLVKWNGMEPTDLKDFLMMMSVTISKTNLTAAFIPKDTIMVHPKMFVLQIHYQKMRHVWLNSNRVRKGKKKKKKMLFGHKKYVNRLMVIHI